jgi:hypothetical protein
MVHIVRWLPLLLLGVLIHAQGASPKVRDRFLGVWKLLSCELKASNGDITYPYGEHPVGRIEYDKAGRMSAQLMRPGRPTTYTRESPGKATREDLLEVLRGFTSYFGTFEIDEATHTVIHHVEASSYPPFVGADLKRTYEFTGNHLTLTATMSTGVMRLVWAKEPD